MKNPNTQKHTTKALNYEGMIAAVQIRGKSLEEVNENMMAAIYSVMHIDDVDQLIEIRRQLKGEIDHLKQCDKAQSQLASAKVLNLHLKDQIRHLGAHDELHDEEDDLPSADVLRIEPKSKSSGTQEVDSATMPEMKVAVRA